MKTKTEKKPAKKSVVEGKGKYTLNVVVNDTDYKVKGESMEDVLSSFVASPSFPFSVKTRVVYSFGDGKKEGVYRQPVAMARRVFKIISRKPSAIEILARKMEQRLA